MEPAALETLREGAKADLAAASLGQAVKLCIEATGVEDDSHSHLAGQDELSGTAVEGDQPRSRFQMADVGARYSIKNQ
jgi:hypothetical protein